MSYRVSRIFALLSLRGVRYLSRLTLEIVVHAARAAGSVACLIWKQAKPYEGFVVGGISGVSLLIMVMRWYDVAMKWR